MVQDSVRTSLLISSGLFVNFISLRVLSVYYPTLTLPPTFEVDLITISQMNKLKTKLKNKLKLRLRKPHSRELKSHGKLGFESRTF